MSAVVGASSPLSPIGIRRASGPPEKEDRERQYKCQFCSQVFSRSEYRSRHEKSHTQENPYKCFVCPITFVRRDLLQRHYTVIHAKYGGVERSERRQKESFFAESPSSEFLVTEYQDQREHKDRKDYEQKSVKSFAQQLREKRHELDNLIKESQTRIGAQAITINKSEIYAASWRRFKPLYKIAMDIFAGAKETLKKTHAESSNYGETVHSPKPAQIFEPRIEGFLQGQFTSALADSGAPANYMLQSYADKHGFVVDRSEATTAKTANGKLVQTNGTTQAQLTFKDDTTEKHWVTFNVVTKCVDNIVIGSPFLRLTQTLSRFAHRISRVLRNARSYRMRYVAGGSHQFADGVLNGVNVSAVLDSGSDANAISEEFAQTHGLEVDRRKENQVEIEFWDGSRAWTSGVLNGEWQYDPDQDDPAVHKQVFYVVPGLEHHVLLGYGLIHDTNAFERYVGQIYESYDSNDDGDDLSSVFAVMKIIGEYHQDQPNSPYQVWQKDKYALQSEREKKLDNLNALPPHEKNEKRAEYLKQWNARWADWAARGPDLLLQASSNNSNNSSSSENTSTASVTLYQDSSGPADQANMAEGRKSRLSKAFFGIRRKKTG